MTSLQAVTKHGKAHPERYIGLGEEKLDMHWPLSRHPPSDLGARVVLWTPRCAQPASVSSSPDPMYFPAPHTTDFLRQLTVALLRP